MWAIIIGTSLAVTISAEPGVPSRGKIDRTLEQITDTLDQVKTSIDDNSRRISDLQSAISSKEHWQTEFLTKTVTLARDVEVDRRERLQIFRVPIGQEGFLDVGSCIVLDAPVWDSQGKLSVHVSVDSPTGESRGICSLIVPGPFSFFAEFDDRPLRFGEFPLQGGETISFSCRSFSESGDRELGDGCTVNVDLWVRLRAKELR